MARMRAQGWRCWVLLLLLAALGSAAAAAEPEGPASLILLGETSGRGRVMLFVERRVADPARMGGALRRTFGVDFLGDEPDGEEEAVPDSLALWAEEVPLFPRQGLARSARMDLAPLLRALRDEHVPSISVHLSHPKAGFTTCAGAKPEGGCATRVSYSLRFPTDTLRPVLDVAFGYRAADLPRAFIAPLLVLLIPVALILRLRRAALRAEAADAATIWFGYLRFSHGANLGMWLAWLFATALAGTGDLVWFLMNVPNALRIAAFTAACLLAPAAVTILCAVLSHPVHARVRGSQWTPLDLAGQAFWGLASGMVPVLLLMAALGMSGERQGRLVPVLLAGAFVFALFAQVRLLKAMDLTPHALEVGELRDRIFALAAKAQVKLRQIYVLPAGKGHLANAFAMRGGNVLLTDYLLRELKKREIDAVTAHELAHLRRRHPSKMRLLTAAAVAFPLALSIAADRLLPTESAGMGTYLTVALAAGLLAVHAVSRRFERAADADAAALTGDPEAMITSLAKLMRLNLLPIDWGRWFERMVTHPSTLRRAQALAYSAGIPAERLGELLGSPGNGGEHYAIPPATLSEKTLFSTAFKHRTVNRIAWSFTAIFTVVPALLLAAGSLLWPAQAGSFLFFCLLLASTVALYLAAADALPLMGYAELHRRLRGKLEEEGIPVEAWEGAFVGYAPGPFPRLYERYYNWDIGFLFLADDRLCYVGEQTRFSLPAERITQIRLGAGPPTWRRSHCLYVSWHGPETSAEGVFSLGAADGRSLRELERRTAGLAKQVEVWREHAGNAAAVPAPLAVLPAPDAVEVTSLSPRALFGCAPAFQSGLTLILFSVCASALLGLRFTAEETNLGWRALAVTLVMSILQWVPLLRYRDRELGGAAEEHPA